MNTSAHVHTHVKQCYAPLFFLQHAHISLFEEFEEKLGKEAV